MASRKVGINYFRIDYAARENRKQGILKMMLACA